MPAPNITSNDDFITFLTQAHGKLVVLDFYADWCSPCKKIAPIFEQLFNDFSSNDVMLAKVDIQACSEVADSFQVQKIPYFIFMREGRVLDNVSGTKEVKEGLLKTKIEGFLKQDQDQQG